MLLLQSTEGIIWEKVRACVDNETSSSEAPGSLIQETQELPGLCGVCLGNNQCLGTDREDWGCTPFLTSPPHSPEPSAGDTWLTVFPLLVLCNRLECKSIHSLSSTFFPKFDRVSYEYDEIYTFLLENFVCRSGEAFKTKHLEECNVLFLFVFTMEIKHPFTFSS